MEKDVAESGLLLNADENELSFVSSKLAGRFGTVYICVEISVMLATLPLSLIDHKKFLWAVFILYGLLSFSCIFGHVWNGEYWLKPGEGRPARDEDDKGKTDSAFGVLAS